MKIEIGNKQQQGEEEKQLQVDENVLGFEHDEKEDIDRPKWANKTQFILSCLGFSVGLGNVWRFPYLAYKNGGGAFLIPYWIMMVLCGLPMYFLEISIGQYFSKGPIQSWRAISPLFAGVGYAMLVVCFLISIYYNVIIGWILFFLFDSFRSDVPWRSCDHKWDSPKCAQKLSIIGNGTKLVTDSLGRNISMCQHSYLDPVFKNGSLIKCILNGTEKISATEEYWNHRVLDITKSVNDIGEVRWELALTLLCAWTVVYFCMWKGVKSVGKAVYFTATFPYVVLIILLIRGLTLPGAIDGIIYYIKLDFGKLVKAEVWAAATTQLFYSLGPAWGVLLSLGSYNSFKNNCLRDAIGLVCMDSITSSLAGFVIFSVLGFMSQDLGIGIDKVVSSGPGLAFTVYPQGIAQMPISPLWAILFFFMLFTLGLGSSFMLPRFMQHPIPSCNSPGSNRTCKLLLDSLFPCIECIITNVIDEFPKKLSKRKEIVILTTCIICFCFGIPMVCQGGMYILNILDTQAGGVSLLFIAATEVIAIGWFYRADRLRLQVSQMIGYMPGLWWSICWRFITPVILVTIFIFHSYSWKGISYDKKPYPAWAEVIGWCIALASIGMIPAFAVINFFRAQGSTIKEKLQNVIKPDERVLRQIAFKHGLSYRDAYTQEDKNEVTLNL